MRNELLLEVIATCVKMGSLIEIDYDNVCLWRVEIGHVWEKGNFMGL